MTVPIFEPIHKALILIAVALGIAVGWMAHSPAKAVHESAAPAQRQADGSLVLARAEGTTTPPAAPHALPKGSVEERRIQVVVQPARGIVVHDHPASSVTRGDALALGMSTTKDSLTVPDDSCDCPPVTVDLSLVRNKDRTHRVVASSPNGQILSGLDIPIDAPSAIPRALPWAAGITMSTDRKFGGFLDRDIGPFRMGVEAFQTTTSWTAQVRAGIRF